jgi:hypothetical protein
MWGIEMARPLNQIASDIESDWKTQHGQAQPFIDAMRTLHSIEDRFYGETAVEIVSRFLDASKAWKGPTAARVKDELRSMVKLKS